MLKFDKHISKLGPEPLSSAFDYDYMKEKSKKRKLILKIL